MWNYKKIAIRSLIALVVLVALVLIWRLDPVQRLLVPERFWNMRILTLEVQLDRLRDRALQCVGAVGKLNEAGATQAKDAPGGARAAAEDMGRLCATYNEEIKRAVDATIEARAALRKAQD